MAGIDGAPYDLIVKWANEGKLPNIKRLLDGSGNGVLKSLLDITPPAWSSIFTGKNAGKHGIFDFKRHKPGSYDFDQINSSMRYSEDVWEMLSKHGFRVGVLNAPITFPVRPVNGFLVSGFLTPTGVVKYSYPESIQNELKTKVPGFKPSSSSELQLQLNKDSYVKSISDQLDNLRKACNHLIKKESLDFFGVFVSESDFVQHWFWGDMLQGERGHPNKYSDVILNTYKAVDQLIGDLQLEMDEDTYLMLVSDHGGTHLRMFFHTNYFLHSIGLLNFKSTLLSTVRQIFTDRGVSGRIFEFMMRKNVFALHYLMRPLILGVSDIDWQKTFAYSFGYGQIYLNVKGREPSGAVPVEKIDQVKKYLVQKLRQVTDPETNASPLEAIYTKEELFSGPRSDYAPDIQLVMKEGYEAFSWSKIADRVIGESKERSGTHNTRGIIALEGAGVVKGNLDGASVLDIAPTILAILGIPIPVDMDGQVIAQAFTQEYLNSNPIKYGDTSKREGYSEYELSHEEQEKIEENLRSLGYI